MSIHKILVFRLGSIGDFAIALPCFHLVRKTFPSAQIALLTNQPVNSRAAPGASVIEGTDLVDQYFNYPPGAYNPREILQLKKTIQSFAPDALIYLAARTQALPVYRDYLFFRLCGIRRIIGLPTTSDLRTPRSPLFEGAYWEPEAQRLGRQLASLGKIDFDLPENWDLHLSSAEIGEATRILKERMPPSRFDNVRCLGISIGTKFDINDWGDNNWFAVLKGLEKPGLGLLFIGSAEDRARSQTLADAWPGPTLNLCGQISPRLSAAVIRNTVLFLCHDSGPMHLAAAVGTRCVAVFSRHNPPGQWYPFGSGHKILYPSLKTETIQSIRPRQVIEATKKFLDVA